MSSNHRHTEELWQYVLARRTFPDIVLNDIEHHLGECGFCKDLVAEIKDFTKARQQVDLDNVHTEAEKLLLKIREGGTTKKRSISLKSKTRPGEAATPRLDRMVLSAASVREKTPAYSSVATLHSADDSILLRVLLEHAKHEYAMYVLAEKQESASYTLIESPLTAHPALTDTHGICRVPVTRELLLESDDFCIHPVVQTYVITDRDIKELLNNGLFEIRFEDCAMEVTFDASTLSVRTVSDQQNLFQWAAFVSSDRKLLEAWLDHHAVFTTHPPTAGDRLLFY